MKTLSVTLIVKNEQNNLSRLLPMLTFADELVIVDTGSTDGTAQIAKQFTDKVYSFVWQDDFSKARNYAISKATCQYVMWLDADDIVPLQTQRAIADWKNARPSDDVYYVKYSMEGQFPFWFWRERIVRRCGKCRFNGFIHEAITPFGQIAYLNCEIVHSPAASHEQRNLQIYRRAIEAGKRFSLRDRFYYAKTLLECGEGAAIPLLRKFAANKRGYVADRVEAYKLLARDALDCGNRASALRYLAKSITLLPPSGEVCCLFAQCYYGICDYVNAKQWYLLALNSSSQSGFVNEYYTKFLPNVQLSVCLWHLGDTKAAAYYHSAAKALFPNNPTVLANDRWFSC